MSSLKSLAEVIVWQAAPKAGLDGPSGTCGRLRFFGLLLQLLSPSPFRPRRSFPVSSEIRYTSGFPAMAGNLLLIRWTGAHLQSHTPENSVQSQLFVHFGLRENPFRGTPDPRFLFHSETHREALASLVNGIGCEFGFQVLVAQPGMGKTTLLFSFLERFRDTAHTAFLFQPQLEPRELLQSLLLELGVVSEDTSVSKLSEQINQVLGRAAEERKRVIVVVDEAQNLDFAVLETLRQLSNFETAHAKLMQIVLAGQPGLVKKLAGPEQEQLRQRISAVGRLSPLTFNETRAYINHRLRTAGYRGFELFTPGAARHIWENSKGVPRTINTLCFNAMLLGFAGNTKSIDESILDEAARDLDMPSILAEIYRLEPSLVVSSRNGNANGTSKVQPIRETKPPVTEDRNTGSAVENIPPALVEAIVRISQTLEEQRVLLAAKSAPSVNSAPATATSSPKVPGTGTVPATSTLSASGKSPVAPTRSTSSGSVEKGLPHNPAKTILPEQKSTGTALPGSPVASTAHPGAYKSSGGASFWPKALALALITGALSFVVVEKSLVQHPAEANATEPSDSSSGYSVPRRSPGDTGDAPLRPSNGTTTNLRARNSGSDEADDVTVRKFPVELVAASGDSTGTPDSKTIFFDQDSAAISRQYRSALQQIADTLSKDPRASAILEGHTDDIGPEAYNMELSSRRAVAVRNTLISEFNVSSEQLTAMGSGSAAPVRPNSNAAGRAYNRRVAVRFVRLGE